MMRIRAKLKPQRVRLEVVKRPKDYYRLRWWWLHELRQLRAKRRVSQINTNKDIKAAQRALSRLREEIYD